MNPIITKLEEQLTAMQAELAKLKAGCVADTPEACWLAAGHNPDKLTNAQVGVKDGWRLLSEEEFKARCADKAPATDTIAYWGNTSQTWHTPAGGRQTDFTYRTRKPAGFFLPPQPVAKPVACDSAAAQPAADPMANVKVGDYLVWSEKLGAGKLPGLTDGRLYRVHKLYDINGCRIGFGINDDRGISCSPRAYWYRLPTRAEIEAHLLAEAAAKGFVVGAKVKWAPTGQHTIHSLRVIWPDTPEGELSWVAREQLHRVNGPTVVMNSHGAVLPVDSDQLTLVKDDPITIMVDGTAYTANFTTPGIVTFACAKIDWWQLQRARDFLSRSQNCASVKQGSREINAVRIGKGVFDLPLLDKLVAKLT